MIRVTDKQYWMDPYLKANIDTIVHNLDRDWDFSLAISGDGKKRVGKSVLAQQIGYYIAYNKKTPFTIKNIAFSGEEIKSIARSSPPGTVIVYDEARGELNSARVNSVITQTLLDFFNECGYLNDVIICVLPNFFDLQKSIATHHTEFLLNCLRTSKMVKTKDGNQVVQLERGYFQYFDSTKKRRLYTLGKKNFDDYSIVKPNFLGEFRDFDIIDKELYKKKKSDYVLRDAKGQDREAKKLKAALKVLAELKTQRQIPPLLSKHGWNVGQPRINQLINEDKESDSQT